MEVVSSDLGQWLELELERLGVPASQRRQTRVTLAARLASAMRGEFNAYPPHEAVVLEAAQRDAAYAFQARMAAARAPPPKPAPPPPPPPDPAPYKEISSKLEKISDDVAFLQIREQASAVRDAYKRRVARREEKIKDLQLIVHELQEELRTVRDDATRTQQTLEDALLERSMEITELRARLQRAEASLAVQDRHRAALHASSERAFEAAMLSRTAPSRIPV